MYKILFVLMICLPTAASAGVYKCKDAGGRTVYSDSPCSASATSQAAPAKPQNQSAQAVPTEAPVKEQYTKDIPELKNTDAATKNCFNLANTTAVFPDPSTSKLVGSSKKWVSVKDVGARQMVTIQVTSKNTAGMYVGKSSFECLLMGDGATVNTKPYELL